jgi:hypothetical protein
MDQKRAEAVPQVVGAGRDQTGPLHGWPECPTPPVLPVVPRPSGSVAEGKTSSSGAGLPHACPGWLGLRVWRQTGPLLGGERGRRAEQLPPGRERFGAWPSQNARRLRRASLGRFRVGQPGRRNNSRRAVSHPSGPAARARSMRVARAGRPILAEGGRTHGGQSRMALVRVDIDRSPIARSSSPARSRSAWDLTMGLAPPWR